MATPPNAVPYQTKPHRLGLKAGRIFNNIQELLTQVEGEGS
jgi:hypothetical protein